MKQSTQNYLKVIFSICYPDIRSMVKVSEISKKLDISPAAVTEMIKKLVSEGYVVNEPYKGVRLTKKGEKIGRNMVRHHRLWEAYLHQVLGLPWDKVHEEAERLEHACSDYLIDKIEEHLGFPQFDPHGNPIPDREGNIPHISNEQSLSKCVSGDACRLVRVVDLDKTFLNYIDSTGLQLGDEIVVKEVLEFDQTFVCEAKGQPIHFSRRAAEHIFVQPVQP